MRQLRAAKPATTDTLTDIQHFADTWEVDPKTVEKWTEIVYLAFDVQLPKSGPFPAWGVSLLELVGKHISKKATLYFAETQEARRLKATEFIKKIRHMRKEGHFQEFQNFQNFQKSQNLQPDDEPDEDEDLEILAEMGAIARQQDNELLTIKRQIEQREDEIVEDVATFIENTDNRKKAKLARRLKTRQLSTVPTGQIIEATVQRLA